MIFWDSIRRAILTGLLLTSCHNGLYKLLSPRTELETITIGISGQSLSHWKDPSSSLPYSISGQVETNVDYLDWSRLYIPTSTAPVNYGTAMLRLGDQLAFYTGRKIRLVFSSVGHTTSEQWKDGLWKRTADASKIYKPDVILWTQGEGDPYTTKDQYKDNIRAVIRMWRSAGIDCPLYCALTQNPSAKTNAVHDAQEELIQEGLMLRGPDIDDMRKTSPWFEAGKTHPSESGSIEQANRWFLILKDKFG